MAKFRIRKGDKVVVIAGKDKGKESRVLRAYPQRERVVCEHIAVAKKAVRPTQQNQKGGFRDMELPIHVSNVMLVCPKCNKPTRVGIKRADDGARVRLCKVCGAEFE
ncbi:MAG: 50S ribosomal protein L24 [Coriobacteriia bacterium]|nr:50S ribosomal protein L24 [Coriobacteriia bacterium]